jgi:acid phosphatase type 7
MATVALALALALLVLALPASLTVTSPYVRPPSRATLSSLLEDDADGQTPQQVRHVALSG